MQQERLRGLSAGQERLYFLQQLNSTLGAAGLYNEHICARFDGPLNVQAMHQALVEVVRRHEILQWVIESDGRCQRAVARDQPFERCVRTVDLQSIQDCRRRERVYRCCATKAAREPFDLAAGPLFRIVLFRLSPPQFAMAVVMHHIITDAFSMQVLVEDLCQAYSSVAAGLPCGGSEVDYRDPVESAWDEDAVTGSEQLTYWTRRLSDTPPPVTLPTSRPRPDIRSFAGAKQYFTFTRETIASMNAGMREERVTRFILLLALWNAYLGINAGRRDLVVGVMTAGRDRDETRRRLGFYVNTLALRTTVNPTDTFRQYLSQARREALEALDHQQVPFERVLQALRLPRSAKRQPLFEVVFVYVNTAVLDLGLPGVNVQLTPDDITLGLTKFDLVLSFWERELRIQGLLDYSTELYDNSEIAAHVSRFQAFAARALDHRDRAMGELVGSAPASMQLIEDLRSAPFAC